MLYYIVLYCITLYALQILQKMLDVRKNYYEFEILR
jgi:hypothetical protein